MSPESCTGGHSPLKSFLDQKKFAIDHENGQNCPKSRVLTMSPDSCSRAHGPLRSSSDHKTVRYRPQKQPEQHEIMSFDDVASVVCRGHSPLKSFPDQKKCAIDHENGQKCPKSRVLTMSPESCYRAHVPLNHH